VEAATNEQGRRLEKARKPAAPAAEVPGDEQDGLCRQDRARPVSTSGLDGAGMAELEQATERAEEPRCDPMAAMNLWVDGERAPRGYSIWTRRSRSWTEVGDQGGGGGEPSPVADMVAFGAN
jgi:hypothetical protein